MTSDNTSRATLRDDAFARPQEVLGGWVPLIIASIISFAALAAFGPF